MERRGEQARLLLARAADDAFMMRELLKNARSPKWGIGFHAQQAVEKAIKAVLCARSVTYPFTHDLNLLLNLLKSQGVPGPPNEERILELMPYATGLRYDAFPDQGVLELDGARAREAVDSALDWARSCLRQEA